MTPFLKSSYGKFDYEAFAKKLVKAVLGRPVDSPQESPFFLAEETQTGKSAVKGVIMSMSYLMKFPLIVMVRAPSCGSPHLSTAPSCGSPHLSTSPWCGSPHLTTVPCHLVIQMEEGLTGNPISPAKRKSPIPTYGLEQWSQIWAVSPKLVQPPWVRLGPPLWTIAQLKWITTALHPAKVQLAKFAPLDFLFKRVLSFLSPIREECIKPFKRQNVAFFGM
jgi:hypothetical protein